MLGVLQVYVHTRKLNPQAWLLLGSGKDRADLEGFESWLEGFLFFKKGRKIKSKYDRRLNCYLLGVTKKASALPRLSFIFLISQSENSPGCQATLVKRRPWPSCHGVCCPQRAALRGTKAGKEGLKGHPPPAPASFYIFRRTFHISTRSCKNLS